MRHRIEFCAPLVLIFTSFAHADEPVEFRVHVLNPDSEFITQLNESDDPEIPYTIVAADAREYREDSDDIAASLIAKLGRGIIFDTLYRDAGHDIAVSLASILGVDGDRAPAPVAHSIVGHHLNYFTNEASLKILAAIE